MSKLTDNDVTNALSGPPSNREEAAEAVHAINDQDWESAAEEARAAGHRVDRTAEGYDVYPRGEVVSGGPSMRFRRGGEDPAGSLNDLRRMKDMRQNPAQTSRFKEGDRVTFSPNPAAMQLYTAGTYPPIGTSGSVTTVPVPGGRKVNMPGPRGGMVYVKWDGWGTIGVFGVDLVRKFSEPHKIVTGESVMITDRELINDLFDWHGGQGDPVYAVASSSQAGRPVMRRLVDEAATNLGRIYRTVKNKKDKDHLWTVMERLAPFGTGNCLDFS